jgi:Fe-S-cluster containining protein
MADWAADRRLLRVIGGQLREAARRAGEQLACKRGCFGCCVGPFPITMLDAARLRRGLGRLAARRRERIVERAGEAWRWMREGYPGDAATGLLTDADAVFDARWRMIPCPALNLETGGCELYAYRPVACRTYGPLVRIEGRDLPACSLNYRGVSEGERERMRVEIDPKGWERESEGETVVAWALKGGAARAGREGGF